MQDLPEESLARMRPTLGRLERQAIELWNTVAGEIRFTEIAPAMLYLGYDDFDALRGLLMVIREEQNRKD